MDQFIILHQSPIHMIVNSVWLQNYPRLHLSIRTRFHISWVNSKMQCSDQALAQPINKVCIINMFAHSKQIRNIYSFTINIGFAHSDHEYYDVSDEKSSKEMSLRDIFDIALTTIAFLSFGMFVLQVIMCITLVNWYKVIQSFTWTLTIIMIPLYPM